MSFEVIFIGVVALLALLIVLGTFVAVIIIIRKPDTSSANQSHIEMPPGPDMSDVDITSSTETMKLPTPTPSEDIEQFLLEQQSNLADFELKDLSTSFKGSSDSGQRSGVILHLTQADTPVVAFNSQVYNARSCAISAETVYGKLELIVAQGRAGVQWEGEPLGILEYSKQRILGPEGQLLGSFERPMADGLSSAEIGSYPIGFYGQKAADLNTKINALSTLRWFGGDEVEPLPAFTDLAPELEDNLTLILLGALVLEIGFFDLL